jgi:hypothetical protein
VIPEACAGREKGRGLLFFRGALRETNNYLREPLRILVNDAVIGLFKCRLGNRPLVPNNIG